MADSSDSVPEPVPEPVPTPVNAPHTEPLSEPIPEAEHDVTNSSAVEEHNVSNVPITGEEEATKPVSERAEDGSGPPATPREPVIVGYAQPDIRCVDE